MALGKVRKYTPKLNKVQKKAYQNALKIALKQIPSKVPQGGATRKSYPRKKATATLIGR